MTLPRGRLFLSDVRLVFVPSAARRGGVPALTAFDLPLVYIRGEQFHQPIFGANYLSGACFSVPLGGPDGGAAPHAFSLTFKEGGCGTFLPLFFSALAAARRAGTRPAGADVELDDLRASALVDPADPTVVFLPDGDAASYEADVAPAPERYPTGRAKAE